MTTATDRLSGQTLHMVPVEYYEAQPADQDYRPETLAAGREAFIHCTDGATNLADTGNRHYLTDRREFLVLVLDLSRVKAPVRYDDPGRIYPHIYGPLNRDAILAIHPFPRDQEGRFLPPRLDRLPETH